MAIRKLCVATVGAGYAARLHGDAWKMVSGFEIRLKAVVDPMRERAENVKNRYGYEEILESYEDLLQDPEIEVIDICTPPNLHIEMAVKALKAGKHVICEKPLTGYFGEPGDSEPIGVKVPKRRMYESVLASMEELQTVWKASGKKFCYAENYAYSSSLVKAIDMVSKKKSRVLFLKAEESLKGSGSLNTGEWKHIGGGALIRAGAHPLSSILAVKKAEAAALGEAFSIVSVTADMGQATKSLADDYSHRHIAARPNDVEDYASLSITFGDGTKASVLASDLVLGGTKGYVEVYTNDSAIRCRVSPTDLVDCYFLDEDNMEEVEISEMLPSKLGWNRPFVADAVIRGFLGELQDFAEAIFENRDPASGIELACETAKVIYGAYVSAEEGKRFVF